ncbi:MAG: deoxyribodipyrimidine photo-lyase [Microgenomates group bacterium]
MDKSSLLNKRIIDFNNKSKYSSGKYVLYWVQSGLRINFNFSLNFAINQANRLNQPLLVYFTLKENNLPTLRQYEFLKQGLINFKMNLERIGVNFFVEKINGFNQLLNVAKKASIVVCDFGYLKGQKKLRDFLKQNLNQAFYQVENDTCFPEAILSKKYTFAFQLRRQIFDKIPYLIDNFHLFEIKNKQKIFNQSIIDIEREFSRLNLDNNVRLLNFKGGEDEGLKILKSFIKNRLSYYKNYHSDPGKDFQSNLSPYLHFGFISAQMIVCEILKNFSLKDENVISFFNELLVWRELARNFVYFNRDYDNWKNLPLWAIKTLDRHQNDQRFYNYQLQVLEKGETEDKFWNAAQKELLITGKMHGYMRMYWAKKVIEWAKNWRQAYQWLVYLNNKYELDGRDPNGYLGIAWSFGQFDRPWKERNIFGMIRYMSAQGLERKFDMEGYLNKIKFIKSDK